MFATLQLFVIAFALNAVKGVNAQVENCARTYTVRIGDVCDSIAADQGVSTYQLETVNNGTIDPFCDNLQPGMQICLALNGQDCQPVHVVADGEGCTSVADAAGISVATLVQNNPNLGPDCTLLFPGLVVCTDPTVVV